MALRWVKRMWFGIKSKKVSKKVVPADINDGVTSTDDLKVIKPIDKCKEVVPVDIHDGVTSSDDLKVIKPLDKCKEVIVPTGIIKNVTDQFVISTSVASHFLLKNIIGDRIYAFKFQSNSPNDYSVEPAFGVVMPQSVVDLKVTPSKQAQAETVTLDSNHMVKLLGQYVLVPLDTTVADISSSSTIFDTEGGNELKVRWTHYPPTKFEVFSCPGKAAASAFLCGEAISAT